MTSDGGHRFSDTISCCSVADAYQMPEAKNHIYKLILQFFLLLLYVSLSRIIISVPGDKIGTLIFVWERAEVASSFETLFTHTHTHLEYMNGCVKFDLKRAIQKVIEHFEATLMGYWLQCSGWIEGMYEYLVKLLSQSLVICLIISFSRFQLLVYSDQVWNHKKMLVRLTFSLQVIIKEFEKFPTFYPQTDALILKNNWMNTDTGWTRSSHQVCAKVWWLLTLKKRKINALKKN